MDQSPLLISPNAMGFVPALLMQVIILAALLTWVQKSHATWLLIAWQSTLCLLVACFLAAHSIYAPFGGLVYWIGCITFAWITASIAIQFAYHFPRLIYPHEARLSLVLSLALTGGFVALMGVEAITHPDRIYYVFEGFYYEPLDIGAAPFWSSIWLFDVLYPAIFLWPAVVWLRQCVQLSPAINAQSNLITSVGTEDVPGQGTRMTC